MSLKYVKKHKKHQIFSMKQKQEQNPTMKKTKKNFIPQQNAKENFSLFYILLKE